MSVANPSSSCARNALTTSAYARTWATKSAQMGLPAQGTFLARDREGRVYIDQEMRSADQATRTGFRLGVFDPSGALLATYGEGGNQVGPAWPTAVRIDPANRVWVIDFDPAVGTSILGRLDERAALAGLVATATATR